MERNGCLLILPVIWKMCANKQKQKDALVSRFTIELAINNE